MPYHVSTPKEEPRFGQPGYWIHYDESSSRPFYRKNSRDLKGYKTANGQWKIRENKLIRSTDLERLTLADGAMLSYYYNVRTVIDFNNSREAMNKGIPIPQAEYKNYPTKLEDMHYMDDDELFGIYYVQTKLVDQAYKNFFKQLLEQKEGAVLYHNYDGSGSVGIATYLLMTVLGMDQNTRIYDFLLSGRYGASAYYPDLKLYVNGIHSRRGGMNNYLKYALGLTPENIEILRAKYLVSTDGKETPYTTEANRPLAPTPTPAPTPAPTPTPTPTPTEKPNTEGNVNGSTESTVTTKPEDTKPETVTKPKPKLKKKVKVLSIKKVKRGHYVFTKAHKLYFKDVKLKHKLGKTKKHSLTQYKIVKKANLKINGKKVSYLQLKNHHGKVFWINSHDVLRVTK